jgi:hypothetical protein
VGRTGHVCACVRVGVSDTMGLGEVGERVGVGIGGRVCGAW